MARLRPGQKPRVPLEKIYAKGLKSLGKKALKATPPGMMLTAAQKIKEEFNRLTKPRKKPEAKTGPIKKSKNTTVKNKNIIKGPKTNIKKRTNKKRKM